MSGSAAQMLSGLSDAIAALVDQMAPMLAAIRTTPGRHISGIIWQPDLVITADQLLPARDSYTAVLAGGILVAARPAGRDTANNLAALRLETRAGSVVIRAAGPARVGHLAVALGATADANSVARLAVIHRVGSMLGTALNSGAADTLALDLPANSLDDRGPVLDATGALLGMAASSAAGQAQVVPYTAIATVLHLLSLSPVAGADGSVCRCSRSRYRRRCARSRSRMPAVGWSTSPPTGRRNGPASVPAISCCRWMGRVSTPPVRCAPSSARIGSVATSR